MPVLKLGLSSWGGHAVVLGSGDSQLGRGEPIRDTARVLSGYCDAIMVRTFGQEKAEELAEFASVPVINGLTDRFHPCQILADLQTVFAEFCKDTCAATTSELLATLRARKYGWLGDGNNMANSWIETAGLLGLDLVIACPKGFEPDAEVVAEANSAENQAQGARVVVSHDPWDAVRGRDVISTDVFASMGQEDEAAARLKAFDGFCLDDAKMAEAATDAIALHCLPAHREEEISESVLEGPQSRVWRQAENRLHAQKALLEWLLAK